MEEYPKDLMQTILTAVGRATKHPHHGDTIKMKVYDIFHKKYTESFENKEIKQSIQFDYDGYARSKMKWHEYIKSIGMTFDKKNGILDPSCHLEWQQRYIKISEDLMCKILTLGLP